MAAEVRHAVTARRVLHCQPFEGRRGVLRDQLEPGHAEPVHAHYRVDPDGLGQAITDLFRVQKRAGEWKVVEHWDVIQDVPETSANDNTMF